METVERLQKEIDGRCECALITDSVNRRYFTKMKSSAGTLVVFPQKAYLIIDFRYIEKARKTAKGCEVILQQSGGGIYNQIDELCEKQGAKSIHIESESVTVSDLEHYREKLNEEIVADDTLSKIIKNIRVVKTPEEIEKIAQAQRIAEKGFEHMLEFIRPGKTEKEIQLELDFFMLKNGAEALSFDTIALSGKNTSLPHGVPSDKKVEKGELVLLDFGAVVDGWHSDMTRTVAVGEPDEEMKRVYETVLDAQLSALEKVSAGMTGSEFDKIARDVISNAGYGENFGHSLGHGVGMEIHESPFGSPSGKEILQENSVITVEPGIYLEDKFGVRIEDFVVVKKNGCENLTKAEKKLIVL